MLGKIILADPYLVSESGHSYSYFDAVRHCLARNGLTSEIVGNKAAPTDFLDTNQVKGEFYSSVRECRRSNIFFGAIFRRNLSMIREKLALDQTSLLIFNSLRPFHLAPLGIWLSSLGSKQRPMVACILHFAPSSPDDERNYRAGFAALASLSLLNNVRLFADTTELRELFAIYTNLPIELSPIPSICERTRITPRTGETLRLVFAGQGRWDKGFHLLPAAAEAIDERPQLNAEFVVQAFNPELRAQTFGPVIARLRSRRATVLENSLSMADYGALIQNADIILLPYSAPHYRQQSSGVFIDAVLSGKVTVAPSESWMGAHIMGRGGGTVFNVHTPDGFRQAVGRALDEFQTLAAQARTNAVAARSFHSADNLTNLLVGSSNGAVPNRNLD